MPDTKSRPNRARNPQAVWQSLIGRQCVIASAGLAFAGTAIPFAGQRVDCDTTNN
ncbi:hypothetical protein [Mesorhizobium delmotii]|uniref:Uncharacterized protein n=1 Tax=Mesorhizobium delmotii TaxID=1631247 RepID=A0A2P9AR41_9HYPH|nr:hypothetical protein [Mesorhizobium delmotii]SJM33572.1 conserved hypothetical protein [Mesorhizobium delmotii]